MIVWYSFWSGMAGALIGFWVCESIQSWWCRRLHRRIQSGAQTPWSALPDIPNLRYKARASYPDTARNTLQIHTGFDGDD